MQADTPLKVVSTVAEPVLALIVAGLLTLGLSVPFLPFGREADLRLRPDPAVEERLSHEQLVARIEALGVARRVEVRLEDGGHHLVLLGIGAEPPEEDLAARVLDAIESSGYSSAAFSTRKVVDLEALAGGDPRQLTTVLALQSAVFLVAGLALMRLRLAPRRTEGASSAVRSFLLGVGGGTAAVLASGVLSLGLEALGLPVEEQAWLQEILADPATLARLLPWLVLVGPLAEEAFFRGYTFGFLRQRLGFPAALLVSSVLFAVIHFNLSGFLIYLIIGVVLAWVYERTSSLMAPIAGHVTVNALVLVTAHLTRGPGP
jgi:membrane protease YdiL (CAAX protease family)